MLATVIILAIIVAIAVIVFAIKAANIKNAIEDIYAKQALLQENSRDHEDRINDHEDRINVNYKSIAELNRRQDEAEKVGNGRYTETCDKTKSMYAELSHDIKWLRNDTMPAIKALQDYNAEREKKAKEAAKAKETAQTTDQPATDPRETRDAKQTAAANRQRFAELRKTMSVREAQEYMGISRTTAKRYEKWRKAQEQ